MSYNAITVNLDNSQIAKLVKMSKLYISINVKKEELDNAVNVSNMVEMVFNSSTYYIGKVPVLVYMRICV